jgi:cytochrome c553
LDTISDHGPHSKALAFTDLKRRIKMNNKLIVATIFGLMIIAGTALAGGDPARGKELSMDCVDCHGENGLGDEEVPGLAGLDEAYQIEQLMAYKSGERTDEEAMIMYAEDLSEQDMADLAAYYAGLEGN